MGIIRIIHLAIRVFKSLIFFIVLFSSVVLILPGERNYESKVFPAWIVKDSGLIDDINNQITMDNSIHFNDIRLRFTPRIDTSYKAILIAIFLISGAYFFILLHVSETVINNIRNRHTFNRENIKRIKILGILIALFSIEAKAIFFINKWWLNANYHPKSLEIIDELPFMWHSLIFGAIIFVLGIAFEQGLKLQEENDFTI